MRSEVGRRGPDLLPLNAQVAVDLDVADDDRERRRFLSLSSTYLSDLSVID